MTPTKPKLATLEQCLPQTQCKLCDYPGCKPYAQALMQQKAPIDRCLPGGIPVLKALGKHLQQPTQHLEHTMHQKSKNPSVAWIDPEACIGCTKCIQACPVDAIIGGPQKMHAIIELECTGCALCIDPCPVDCITLPPIPTLPEPQRQKRSQHFKNRYEAHQQRLTKTQKKQAAAHKQKKLLAQNKQQTQQARLAFIKSLRNKQTTP
jgi:Na+-translocating ferredoxin:NAD+ oxidoreductase subunit B